MQVLPDTLCHLNGQFLPLNQAKISVLAASDHEADVRAADEVILTSASKEVLAVSELDGAPVGHGALRGEPKPVYARLYEAYQRAKQAQSI